MAQRRVNAQMAARAEMEAEAAGGGGGARAAAPPAASFASSRPLSANGQSDAVGE